MERGNNVPKGLVMVTIMFFISINGMPDGIQSYLNLYDYDAKNHGNCEKLLTAVENYMKILKLYRLSKTWEMQFNAPKKCYEKRK